MYSKGKKTEQLEVLIKASHNPQAIYKQASGQLIRQWLAEGVFLGVNTRPFVPQLWAQLLCNNRGELIIGHREITKVPQKSISWFAGPGYVTFKPGAMS